MRGLLPGVRVKHGHTFVRDEDAADRAAREATEQPTGALGRVALVQRLVGCAMRRRMGVVTPDRA